MIAGYFPNFHSTSRGAQPGSAGWPAEPALPAGPQGTAALARPLCCLAGHCPSTPRKVLVTSACRRFLSGVSLHDHDGSILLSLSLSTKLRTARKLCVNMTPRLSWLGPDRHNHRVVASGGQIDLFEAVQGLRLGSSPPI